MRMNVVITSALLSLLLGIPGVASAQGCYSSSIMSPTPFMGNNGEVFRLADGTVWEVTYEYEYMYEYYPAVVACPSNGKLLIGKKALNVRRLSGLVAPPTVQTPLASPQRGWEVFEETNLKGSVSGTVQAGRIFQTTSGNIYEVVGLTLQLVLELQPDTLVLRNGETYKLIVKGFDEPLICRRLATASGAVIARTQATFTVAGVVESRIDGEFTGWAGETIFKLENGQIWQQASYAYTYHYAYNPPVIIYASGGTFKMRVDGVNGEIAVTRLR